jgi:hypothetical protein
MTVETGAVEKVARAMLSSIEARGDIDSSAGRLMNFPERELSLLSAAAISAYHAFLAEKGMVIVPVEPTEAMVMAGHDAGYYDPMGATPQDCWRAMLSARPMVPASEGLQK